MAKARMHWFQGDSVVELYRRLGAADPSTARFEIHTDAVTGKPTLNVVDVRGGVALAAALPMINESHPCPPDCPDQSVA